jgi:hypothetical protein
MKIVARDKRSSLFSGEEKKSCIAWTPEKSRRLFSLKTGFIARHSGLMEEHHRLKIQKLPWPDFLSFKTYLHLAKLTAF